ncbi:SDR family NAD(P)-dependent oxidoreductase [Pedobacter jejuensis]|uniref:Glucose 1-dehydrogenase n=1 Tax=Pedobacter jejuensis TaxID=1268550 RepID=A0A3N0BVT6_9SPHI|nr:glucose 1-dehydrogenase [Pedobacter jejuensis]RNL53440.1 glucose 1-dehydrogenase [Pedobacter jejuensis]
MAKKFKNKVALITGSSQGIGAACALRLAKDGADVILNGHKFDERGEKLIRQIKAMGRKVSFLEADISSVAEVVKLIKDAIKIFGKLDILINNAGLETKSDFLSVSEKDYDKVMDTNLKGVFFATQTFAKYCKSKKRAGVVVNMSSVHEEIVFPNFAAYCVSKGGLKMLTRNLASELAPLRIRINNVAPGAVSTPINQDLLNNKKQLKSVLENIPLKRMGKVEEVAAVVAFLASDEAAYVTGSTYFVDGGLTYHYEEQ